MYLNISFLKLYLYYNIFFLLSVMLPIFRDRIRMQYRRLLNLPLIQQRARIRRESNAFNLTNNRFIELFRLNKDLARELMELIRPHFPHPPLNNRGRGSKVTIEIAVLATLRFYATGTYQRSLGQDFNFGISQTSASRWIHRITQIIDQHLADAFIKFPDGRDERQLNKATFMDRFGFPGAVGAIDCTHIAILKPKVDEHNFLNRKGYHSLNVQCICDPNMMILNLNTNYGGATHDSFIWRQSGIQQILRHIHNMGETNSWLIGDSGYPLQPYLMKPFLNPAPNTPESRFNTAHSTARNVVERTFGILKMRFRCLLKERVARYAPHFVGMLATTCSILHNMCIAAGVPLLGEANEELPDEDNFFDFPNGAPYPDNLFREGERTRNNILQRYFVN